MVNARCSSNLATRQTPLTQPADEDSALASSSTAVHHCSCTAFRGLRNGKPNAVKQYKVFFSPTIIINIKEPKHTVERK
jgi:hypothetical protein